MSTLIVFGLTVVAVFGLVITLRMAGISVWQFFREVYWPFGGANYVDVMEALRQDLAGPAESHDLLTAPSPPSASTRMADLPSASAPPNRSAPPARTVSQVACPPSPCAGPVTPAQPPIMSAATTLRSSQASERLDSHHTKPPHALPAPLLDDDTILSVARRRHTAIVGVTGDGKTTCSYTLLVRDLAEGCQCVVISRHFSPYHQEDQRIDLRPIAHLFEAYRTPAEIGAALEQLASIIDARLDQYYANQPIGHPLVVYLGEWRSLRRMLGKRANEMFEKILDEGRKVKVWAVVELHSALIAYMGSDSGTREAFGTCLVGNVDPVSWKTLMGACAQYPVPLGYWATERGMIQIVPPSSAMIAALARRPAPSWNRIVPSPTPPAEGPPVRSDDDDEESSDRSKEPASDHAKQSAPDHGAQRMSLHPEVVRVLAKVETVEELSRLLLIANGGQRSKVRRLVRGDNVALGHLLHRLVEELGL